MFEPVWNSKKWKIAALVVIKRLKGVTKISNVEKQNTFLKVIPVFIIWNIHNMETGDRCEFLQFREGVGSVLLVIVPETFKKWSETVHTGLLRHITTFIDTWDAGYEQQNSWSLMVGGFNRGGTTWTGDLSPYLETFMEPRNRFWETNSASLCSLASLHDKHGCCIGPPGWESIPGLLKRFTNTSSEKHKNWTLPKDINANRFFWDSHWLEIWKNHYVPLWDRIQKAWLWTQAFVESRDGRKR